MRYIYLIAAFNALFFTALLWQKKKALHDKILVVWMIYLGLYTGTYGLFSDVLFSDYHLLSASFISLLLLHGPFMFLYISALTGHKFRLGVSSWYHFIPFLLFNVYLLAVTFIPGSAEHIRLDHVESGHNAPVLFNLFLILTVLSGPVYFFLAVRLFRKLDFTLENNFSTPERVNPDWLKKLVYTFGIVWTILIIAASMHHVFHFYSLQFCTDGLFLSLSFFIILIGYFGLKQQQIFIQYPDRTREYVTEPVTKYAARLLEEDEADRLVARLQEYMTVNKPWLDAGLTLPDLADMLQVPSHHLSRAINENLGLNFYEFVNRYRVEEVKAKLSDPSFRNLSLLGIAYDSGFNTKSAFNRVFKKLTGTTPSAYKKQLTAE